MSALRQLLDEVSWEGNARKYRGGGLGLENVLTVEVFQALDLLPRETFLGEVLRGVGGRQFDASRDEVELARVSVLPGDVRHDLLNIRAQPDVSIHLPSTFVFVEAKRMAGGVFGPDQLAKEVVLTAQEARGREPVLLLVLGAPPPVSVRGHGRMSIAEALTVGAELITARHGPVDLPPRAEQMVAWTTWAEIGERVRSVMGELVVENRSVHGAITRLAASLTEALDVHDV